MTPLLKISTRQSILQSYYRIPSRVVQHITVYGLNPLLWASAQAAKTSPKKCNEILLLCGLRLSTHRGTREKQDGDSRM